MKSLVSSSVQFAFFLLEGTEDFDGFNGDNFGASCRFNDLGDCINRSVSSSDEGSRVVICGISEGGIGGIGRIGVGVSIGRNRSGAYGENSFFGWINSAG